MQLFNRAQWVTLSHRSKHASVPDREENHSSVRYPLVISNLIQDSQESIQNARSKRTPEHDAPPYLPKWLPSYDEASNVCAARDQLVAQHKSLQKKASIPNLLTKWRSTQRVVTPSPTWQENVWKALAHFGRGQTTMCQMFTVAAAAAATFANFCVCLKGTTTAISGDGNAAGRQANTF